MGLFFQNRSMLSATDQLIFCDVPCKEKGRWSMDLNLQMANSSRPCQTPTYTFQRACGQNGFVFANSEMATESRWSGAEAMSREG
jgi:hypothetical protein